MRDFGIIQFATLVNLALSVYHHSDRFFRIRFFLFHRNEFIYVIQCILKGL
jgi:hypothetical protein